MDYVAGLGAFVKPCNVRLIFYHILAENKMYQSILVTSTLPPSSPPTLSHIERRRTQEQGTSMGSLPVGVRLSPCHSELSMGEDWGATRN